VAAASRANRTDDRNSKYPEQPPSSGVGLKPAL
jgi:hypothetical protein